MTKQHFLIVSNVRTGSTWLQFMLGDLKDVETDFEVKIPPLGYEPAPIHKVIESTDFSFPDFFDSITVLRVEELDGMKVWVVRLEVDDIPDVIVWVDPATGDVLKADTRKLFPGVGEIPITSRFEDYRVLHGVRIPSRIITSEPVSGRIEMEVSRFDVGVEVDADLFRIEAPDDEAGESD